jgi:hypothetical protein
VQGVGRGDDSPTAPARDPAACWTVCNSSCSLALPAGANHQQVIDALQAQVALVAKD